MFLHDPIAALCAMSNVAGLTHEVRMASQPVLSDAILNVSLCMIEHLACTGSTLRWRRWN